MWNRYSQLFSMILKQMLQNASMAAPRAFFAGTLSRDDGAGKTLHL
jgi:hypothetical protein